MCEGLFSEITEKLAIDTGPEFPQLSRSPSGQGCGTPEADFGTVVNRAIWAMGCVGPRPGTPPSESDSRPAEALATGIFDLRPGAAPGRRVNRRPAAGPLIYRHPSPRRLGRRLRSVTDTMTAAPLPAQLSLPRRQNSAKPFHPVGAVAAA